MTTSTGEPLPEHVRANREAWDRYAHEYAERGRRNWAEEPHWGIWHIPETELRLLPDDLAGKDVVELGCGTAYVSAWLAKRGARPVGIDNSPAQLETARMLQQVGGHHVITGNDDGEIERVLDEMIVSATGGHGAKTDETVLEEWTTEVQMKRLLVAAHG